MVKKVKFYPLHMNISHIEVLIHLESDYLFGKISKNEMHVILKNFSTYYENETSHSNKNIELFELISMFLVLERLKRNLLFENQILNVINSEINVFTYKLNYFNNFYKNQRHNFVKNETTDDDKNDNIENCALNEKRESKPHNLRYKRSNYSKKISGILKQWLRENVHNPYPSESEKLILIKLTGLNAIQVNNWFINARRRILPCIKSKCTRYN